MRSLGRPSSCEVELGSGVLYFFTDLRAVRIQRQGLPNSAIPQGDPGIAMYGGRRTVE